jgi:putative flippase GtrA
MQMPNLFSIELRFLLIGAWNTVVGFALYTVLLSSLPKDRYIIALISSSLIAGAHAYFTQRVFVWKSQGDPTSQFLRFALVLIAQFAANFFLLYLAVDFFGRDALRSQYAIGMIIVVLTFYTHKHWTFHND